MFFRMLAMSAITAAGIATFGYVADAQAQDSDSLSSPRDQFSLFMRGGVKAGPNEFPFQVSLINAATKQKDEYHGHQCGGTLIDAKWVLTAAHCLGLDPTDEDFKSIEVYVGSANFEGGDRIPIVWKHHNWGFPYEEAPNMDNDIALLRLLREPKRGITYKTIKLEDQNAAIADGADVIAIGWGFDKNGNRPKDLQKVPLNIVNLKTCNNIVIKRAVSRMFGDLEKKLHVSIEETQRLDLVQRIATSKPFADGSPLNDTMICAGDQSPRSPSDYKSPCRGDSGGPLLQRAGAEFVQIGIISWNYDCRKSDSKPFTVNTRVSKFRNWIKDAMEIYERWALTRKKVP